MSDAPLDGDEARHQLYEIMKGDAPFEEKARRVLELGVAYLGVDNGHIARIDTDTDYWEAIVSTDPPDGEYPPGLVLDLATTYCQTTLEADDPVALHDAPAQGWADAPAFETHGLHCYHGTTLTVEGDPYGTICFVADEPRDPFTEGETMFVELVTRMLEHELERAGQRAQIDRRTALTSVLNRVLRHNLRNDMTVIRGCVDLLADPDRQTVDVTETVVSKIDDLLELSESARELERIVTAEYDQHSSDLPALVESALGAVQADYPEASYAMDGVDDVTVTAKASLEIALQEVIENAVKHAPDPHVTVSSELSGERIEVTVTDNGPGLPDHERAALTEGTETPLVHGSGLGLWLTYWIVTDHDGTIDTEVTDEGTRVTVSIPRTRGLPAVSETETLHRQFQSAQDRFQAVFEESFDAMLVADDEGRYVDANEQAAELLGCSREELLGKTVGDFAPGDVDAEVAWEAFRDSDHQRGTFPLVRADGTERLVEYAATPDIVPGKHLSVLRDVTERDQRQRELERYETVLETISDSVWVYDENKRITFVNEQLLDRLGLDREDVVDTPLAATEDVFAEPGAYADWEHVLEEILAGNIAEAERDVAFDLPEGRVVANTKLAPVTEDGEQVGVVVVARDITARREREREVIQQTELLATLFSDGPALLWTTDDQGIVTRSRGAALANLDREGEVVGNSVFEVFDDHATLPGLYERVLDGEAVTATVDLDGTSFEFWMHPLRSTDGTVTGTIALAYDRRTREDTTPTHLEGQTDD